MVSVASYLRARLERRRQIRRSSSMGRPIARSRRNCSYLESAPLSPICFASLHFTRPPNRAGTVKVTDQHLTEYYRVSLRGRTVVRCARPTLSRRCPSHPPAPGGWKTSPSIAGTLSHERRQIARELAAVTLHVWPLLPMVRTCHILVQCVSHSEECCSLFWCWALGWPTTGGRM